MQAFKAVRIDVIDVSANQQAQSHTQRVRAPGRTVMVVREGSCWVRLQEGNSVELTAVDVVTWEAGEYIHYGTNPAHGCKAEIYWSAKPPERP